MAQQTSRQLVSILVNNYNYANFLAEAIDSALDQTYSPCEVIVVDDGSTDNSREVIMSFGDRITPIFKENGGQATAFNVGFEASKGEVICFLDADDVFIPEKVESVVSALLENPEAGWIFHSVALIKSVTISKAERLQAAEVSSRSTATMLVKVDVRQKMRRGQLGNQHLIPPTSGMSFTRACLQRILPMPASRGILLSDSYLKFVAMGIYKGISIYRDLTIQRIHGANLFTLKQDNTAQAATVLANTAFFMRKKFPTLEKFSDNLFASGLSLDKALLKDSHELASLVQKYLAGSSFRQRVTIFLKQCFYLLKAKM